VSKLGKREAQPDADYPGISQRIGQILALAQDEANKTIEAARQEAERITAEARRDAAEIPRGGSPRRSGGRRGAGVLLTDADHPARDAQQRQFSGPDPDQDARNHARDATHEDEAPAEPDQMMMNWPQALICQRADDLP